MAKVSAPSSAEVRDWLSKVDDVTAAISEILHADPADEMRRREARERRQREEQEAARAERLQLVKMRYEPKYYSRFERDDVIDAMLRAVDEAEKGGRRRGSGGLKGSAEDPSLYSTAERVSLAEARRLKEEGGRAVQRGEWAEAFERYTDAIKLQPVDEGLLVVLHNNRALAGNKLRRHLEAAEDASFVLQREPRNAKALLRRAHALRALHRPVEALRDAEEVLRLEPRNPEAAAARRALRRAERELLAANALEERHPEAAARVCAAAAELAAADVLPSRAAAVCWALLGELQAGSSGGGGPGAMALFAVRGGVPGLLALARRGLETSVGADEAQEKVGKAEERAALAVAGARALGTLLAGCEVACQEVPDDDAAALLRLALQVAEAPQTGGAAVLAAALELADGLCVFYGVTVARVCAERPGALPAAWQHSVEVKSALAQYLCTRLLCALLAASTNSSVSGDESVQRLTRTLLHGAEGQTEEEPPVVARALRAGLVTSAPPAQQVAAATLALRVTTITGAPSPDENLATLRADVLRRDGTVGRGLLPVAAAAERRLLLRHRCDAQGAAAADEGAADATDNSEGDAARVLEAAYSVLYNIALQSDSREAFCAEWCGASKAGEAGSALGERAVALVGAASPLLAQVAPLPSRVFAFLSKIVAADPATQAALTRQDEQGGWLFDWLSAAVTAATEEKEEKEKEEAEAGGAEAWELAEHLSTLLGAAHARLRLWPPAALVGNAVSALLPTVAACALPGDEQLRVICRDGGGDGGGEGVSRERLRAHAATLALGNAALLLSRAAEETARQGLQQRAARAYSRAGAVPTLLARLREARAAAMVLSSEAAAAGVPPATREGLRRWAASAKSAQQNVAIAIGRVVALGEDLRNELRDLRGFETLLAVQQSQ